MRAAFLQLIPNEGIWQVMADWFAAYMNDLAIKGMKALATAFWFLEKIAAGITRFFLNENVWDLIVNGVLSQLKTLIPSILYGIMFAPGAGLVYLALFMAGLLMVIPGIDNKRLIDPGRVVLWGIIIGTLFVINTIGYDIIGAIEQLRADTTQIIIGTSNRNLDSLVSVPMKAPTNSDLENYSFVLTNPFETEYFPEL